MSKDKKEIYKDMMSDTKIQDYLKSKDKPGNLSGDSVFILFLR